MIPSCHFGVWLGQAFTLETFRETVPSHSLPRAEGRRRPGERLQEAGDGDRGGEGGDFLADEAQIEKMHPLLQKQKIICLYICRYG